MVVDQSHTFTAWRMVENAVQMVPNSQGNAEPLGGSLFSLHSNHAQIPVSSASVLGSRNDGISRPTATTISTNVLTPSIVTTCCSYTNSIVSVLQIHISCRHSQWSHRSLSPEGWDPSVGQWCYSATANGVDIWFGKCELYQGPYSNTTMHRRPHTKLYRRTQTDATATAQDCCLDPETGSDMLLEQDDPNIWQQCFSFSMRLSKWFFVHGSLRCISSTVCRIENENCPWQILLELTEYVVLSQIESQS